MQEKIIKMSDIAKTEDKASISTITEKMSAGPKGTKVTFINHDTGEIIGEYHNKVVLTGSLHNAMSTWGADSPVVLPSYNSEMGLDGSKGSGTTPINPATVCLFCVGDDGCGTEPKDVKVTSYIDRIAPAKNITNISDFTQNMIFPFRFVPITDDLNSDLRKYYYGRKTFTDINRIGYYFKTFDTTPQIHLRYTDGTQVTENLYNYDSEQSSECYIETRLRITRLDFRDYFEQVLGWDNARISSLSLCWGWPDDESEDYIIYNDIFPYSKLNFSFNQLVDSTIAIDIIYDVYY